MQVLPGIYEINGSEFGRWQNTFLVDHAGATIMIDCGDMSNSPVVAKDHPAVNGLHEVEENARIWGYELDQVSHLFVTHEHFDHCSHAAELQRRGVTIVASPQAAEAMAASDERVIGWAHGRPVEPCTPDVVVDHQAEVTVAGLTVRGLAVPGHSDGSMVWDIVVDGKRSWFVGDLFSTTTAHKGVLLPWMGDVNADKAEYVRSLRRLLAETEQPDNVFAGHGPSAIGFGNLTVEMAYWEALTRWRTGGNQA